MIYQFKMTSIENPDFERQIEIDAESSFADFHECIQDTCNYGPDQLASFFVAARLPGRQIEITLLDMGLNGLQSLIMGKTKLKDMISENDQRLLYVFDFFSDRSFYIELTQNSMEKNLQEPRVTYKKGNAPVQVLEQDVQNGVFKNSENDVLQDYGDLDDYTEIFGEMEDLVEGD